MGGTSWETEGKEERGKGREKTRGGRSMYPAVETSSAWFPVACSGSPEKIEEILLGPKFPTTPMHS